MSVTIRRAGTGDEAIVAQLARLDSRTPLVGPCLLAEIDNVAVAALSLSTGEVAADPFRRTQDVVDLLHARAQHLRRTHARRRRATTVFAPRAA